MFLVVAWKGMAAILDPVTETLVTPPNTKGPQRTDFGENFAKQGHLQDELNTDTLTCS